MGVQIFLFMIEIDQAKTTKSHMFNISLRLTNHECLTAK